MADELIHMTKHEDGIDVEIDVLPEDLETYNSSGWSVVAPSGAKSGKQPKTKSGG